MTVEYNIQKSSVMSDLVIFSNTLDKINKIVQKLEKLGSRWFDCIDIEDDGIIISYNDNNHNGGQIFLPKKLVEEYNWESVEEYIDISQSIRSELYKIDVHNLNYLKNTLIFVLKNLNSKSFKEDVQKILNEHKQEINELTDKLHKIEESIDNYPKYADLLREEFKENLNISRYELDTEFLKQYGITQL